MRIRATMIGLFTLALLVFASNARAAQVSIGVVIGAPPPPPRVIYAPPPPPQPAYVWVPGYWYPVKHQYRWHEGYYTLPPYEGAVWVGPRYERGQFFEGYWVGRRGRVEHDHRWDRDEDRDHDWHGNGHGRGRGRGHDRD
jgi:hypothetical protein